MKGLACGPHLVVFRVYLKVTLGLCHLTPGLPHYFNESFKKDVYIYIYIYTYINRLTISGPW